MAQASRTERKIRRLKRERTLALRFAQHMQRERDLARWIAVSLETELKKYVPTPKHEGGLTITKVEDDTHAEGVPVEARGPNPDGDRLEVSEG